MHFVICILIPLHLFQTVLRSNTQQPIHPTRSIPCVSCLFLVCSFVSNIPFIAMCIALHWHRYQFGSFNKQEIFAQGNIQKYATHRGRRLIIKGIGFISLSKYTSSCSQCCYSLQTTNCLHRLHCEKVDE